jgi:AAA domain/Bifunctional DNA primase/polymerase, N-terminal
MQTLTPLPTNPPQTLDKRQIVSFLNNELDFMLIPLAERTKTPIVTWKNYSLESAPIPEDTLNWFWDENREIGILTGERSRIVVVDADDAKSIELVETLCPRTPMMTETSKGRHYYYAHPGIRVMNAAKLIIGGVETKIDIRGDGGFAVAPGSVHRTGFVYSQVGEWSSAVFKSLPVFEPAWLSIFPNKSKKPSSKKASSKSSSTPATSMTSYPTSARIKRAMAYADACPPAIDGQGGSKVAFALACKMVDGFALSELEAFDVMASSWNSKCQPPWSDTELAHKIEDATIQAGNSGYMLDANKKKTTVDFAEPLSDQPDEESNFEGVWMDTVKEEKLQWLWEDRIPKGMLSIIQGDGGHGKSFVTLDIASRLSTGTPFHDTPNSPNPKGKTLLFSTEDIRECILKPRLRKQKADCSQIKHVQSKADGTMVDLGADLESIRQELETHNFDLLIFDPINSYMGSDTKINGDNAVRAILTPLHLMAREFGIAVIIIQHINKDKTASAQHRGLGSVAYNNLARNVLMVSPDKDDPSRKILTRCKSNISGSDEAVAYRISADCDKIPYLEWETGTFSISADEALNGETAIGSAVEWLKDLLTIGQHTQATVYQAASDDGISIGTLRRAKNQLGVISSKENGKNGQWYWKLSYIDGANIEW